MMEPNDRQPQLLDLVIHDSNPLGPRDGLREFARVSYGLQVFLGASITNIPTMKDDAKEEAILFDEDPIPDFVKGMGIIFNFQAKIIAADGDTSRNLGRPVGVTTTTTSSTRQLMARL
jgi:hypothetical protein